MLSSLVAIAEFVPSAKAPRWDLVQKRRDVFEDVHETIPSHEVGRNVDEICRHLLHLLFKACFWKSETRTVMYQGR